MGTRPGRVFGLATLAGLACLAVSCTGDATARGAARGALVVTVRDAEGQDVPGAVVTLEERAATGRITRTPLGRTTAGLFELGPFHAPRPGATLRAEAPGYARLQRPWGGEEAVDLVLVREAGIRGTVRDARGPVFRAMVGVQLLDLLQEESPDTLMTPFTLAGRAAFTERDGTFELRGLASTRVAIVVEAQGRARWIGPAVELVPGACVEAGTIWLDPGRPIEGHVRDAETGAAVAGATVHVVDQRWNGGESDEEGWFCTGAVAAGRHAVVAEVADGRRSRVLEVALREDGSQDPTPLDLLLLRSRAPGVADVAGARPLAGAEGLVRLRGFVVDAVTRAPLSGAFVQAASAGHAESGPGGEFVLDVPADGELDLVVTTSLEPSVAGDRRGTHVVVARGRVVQPVGSLVVEATVSREVHVHVADRGQPRAGVSCAVLDGASPLARGIRTDATGTATVIVSPASRGLLVTDRSTFFTVLPTPATGPADVSVAVPLTGRLRVATRGARRVRLQLEGTEGPGLDVSFGSIVPSVFHRFEVGPEGASVVVVTGVPVGAHAVAIDADVRPVTVREGEETTLSWP